MYLRGQGTAPNREKAMEYLSQAAAMGNESAFQLLNQMEADQTSPDEEQGVDPFAKQAYLDARQALEAKETERYVNLLTQAANLGYIQALNDLGDLYFNGESVPADMAKAYDYFAKASQKGSGYGSYSCGFMLLRGAEGVTDADRELLGRLLDRFYRRHER